MFKVCSECKCEKEISNFSIRKGRNTYRSKCNQCRSEEIKKWRIENPEGAKKATQNWRENNPEKVKESERRASKKKTKTKKKQYNNKWLEKNPNYYSDYNRARSIKDLSFKIRRSVSSMIGTRLKSNNSSKKGKSSWKTLPYTIDELKQHIESLFEPWMTFENNGKYNSKTWDDNDHSTWKWQLDHIIPHSTFNYEDMECEEFQKCWALSNLRPLSAKQNQLDGGTKVRHIKKDI